MESESGCREDFSFAIIGKEPLHGAKWRRPMVSMVDGGGDPLSDRRNRGFN